MRERARMAMWPTRRTRAVLLVVVIVTNSMLELSSAVGQWWERSSDSPSALPSVVRDVVASRPETNEGDVHLIMWFVAAALLLLTVRRWRQRIPGLTVMWLYTGLLELLQSWLTTSRSAQWSDLGANALGIASAGAAVAIAEWMRRLPQRSRRIVSET